MSLKSFVRFNSSWLVKDGKGSLQDVLCCRLDEEDEASEAGLPTKHVTLMPPGEDTAKPCFIQIQCQKSDKMFSLDAVDILCDARYMEIHGEHDEYLATDQGMRVDDGGDHQNSKRLYLLQYSFTRPTTHCRIKLIPSDKSLLWIHSIQITLKRNSPQIKAPLGLSSDVDVSEVKSLLGDKVEDLKDGAKSLMQTLEARQRVVADPVDFGSFLSCLLSGANKQSFGEETLANFSKEFMNKKLNPVFEDKNGKNTVSSSISHSSLVCEENSSKKTTSSVVNDSSLNGEENSSENATSMSINGHTESEILMPMEGSDANSELSSPTKDNILGGKEINLTASTENSTEASQSSTTANDSNLSNLMGLFVNMGLGSIPQNLQTSLKQSDQSICGTEKSTSSRTSDKQTTTPSIPTDLGYLNGGTNDNASGVGFNSSFLGLANYFSTNIQNEIAKSEERIVKALRNEIADSEERILKRISELINKEK